MLDGRAVGAGAHGALAGTRGAGRIRLCDDDTTKNAASRVGSTGDDARKQLASRCVRHADDERRTSGIAARVGVFVVLLGGNERSAHRGTEQLLVSL